MKRTLLILLVLAAAVTVIAATDTELDGSYLIEGNGVPELHHEGCRHSRHHQCDENCFERHHSGECCHFWHEEHDSCIFPEDHAHGCHERDADHSRPQHSRRGCRRHSHC